MVNNTPIMSNIDFQNKLQAYCNNISSVTLFIQTYSRKTIISIEQEFEDNLLLALLKHNIKILIDENEQKEKELQFYPYGDCKTSIEVLPRNQDEIKNQLDKIIDSMNPPSIDQKLVTSNHFITYILKATDKTGKVIYFMTKKNPVNAYKRKSGIASFIKGETGHYTTMTSDLLHLTTTIDAIITDDFIYLFTLNLEKTLGLQTVNKRKKQECLVTLEKILKPNEFGNLHSTFESARAQTFKSVDPNIVQMLSIPEQKAIIMKKLSIPLIGDNEYDFSDEKSAKLLLSYFQHKLGRSIDDQSDMVTSKTPLLAFN